jgi:hypothetical protein
MLQARAAAWLSGGSRVADVICRGESEDGADRGLERAGVALYLGEQEATLERCQEGDRELIRIHAGSQPPGRVQGAQPLADRG